MLDVCYYSSATGYGGAEKYLETLMVGCVDSGLDCLMIVNSDNKRFQAELDGCKAPYIAIDMGAYKPSMYVQIFNILTKRRPTLLHINLPGPWGGALVACIARMSGIKSIVTTEHLPMFGPSLRHSPIKKLDNRFIDRVITVSYENVRYLKNLHQIKKEKIDVVHNGVDIDQFTMANNKDERLLTRKNYGFVQSDLVFGIVGRITEQKGHQYAIHAVAKLRKKYPAIKVAILGDGELMESCKELVENLNIESQVSFIGFQSDMQRAYRTLDALLMPSTFEALPLTLLEAMASGVPVVASNINGIPEVIEDGVNGFLVPPTDINALVNRIELIYNDRSLLYQMGVAARKTIALRFSLRKMIIDTVLVYRKASPLIDAKFD